MSFRGRFSDCWDGRAVVALQYLGFLEDGSGDSRDEPPVEESESARKRRIVVEGLMTVMATNLLHQMIILLGAVVLSFFQH